MCHMHAWYLQRPEKGIRPPPPTQNWSYSVNYQVGVGNGIMPSARTCTLNHRAFLLAPTSETLCPSISNWLWWHIPIISVFGKERLGIKTQGEPQIHSKFGASLGYMKFSKIQNKKLKKFLYFRGSSVIY